MSDVLGDDAPSLAIIHRWFAEFQRGSLSTEDEHRRRDIYRRQHSTCQDMDTERLATECQICS